MENIRFAITGLGHIGRRHADMVAAHPDCELAAIIDTDTQKAGKAAGYNAPFYPQLSEYLHMAPLPDVVCIATPNALHAQQAISCLEAGTHVVIEKPIALTTGDCKLILDCAAANNRQVFCVMQNRYSAPMQWLKNLLAGGTLGKVYMVNVQCYWNRDSRYYTGNTWQGRADMDGGTLFTQFSHYVDLLYWLFGDVRNIKADFANFNHEGMIDFEDSAHISFSFPNNAIGSLTYSTATWDKNMESTMTILAENGTIKIGGQYMDKVEYCHIKNYEWQDNLSSQAGFVPGYDNAKANHYFVIQNVVDVLRGKADVDTNALEGTKVVDIIERIYALKK